MIRPLVQDVERELLRCVYDIETDSKGYLLQIGYVIGKESEVRFVDTFNDMIRVLIDVYRLTTCKGIQLWAHNGFRFDHMYLLYDLAGQGRLDLINGVFDGGQIMALDIKIRGVSFYLQDSFSLFQSSLAKVTNSFNTTYKKRTDLIQNKTPEELWLESKTLFYDYLRFDVLSLQESLDKLHHLLRVSEPRIVNLPSTVGSLAMKIFRANLSENVMTSGKKLDVFERSSYFGGLCDCLQVGEFERVVGLDVNSMYPTQLCDRSYPTSYLGVWVSGSDFDEKELGLWHITYDTSPYRFIYDCDTRSLAYRGNAVVDTDTVRYLQSYSHEVRVNYGYIYKKTTTSMFNYLKSYYEWKCQGGALGLFAKYVLNSTYGKFGQKHTKSIICQLSKDQMVDMIKQGKVFHEYNLNNEFQFHTYTKEGVSPYTFTVIASLVTLRARLFLHDTVRQFINNGHRVVYYDTDSIQFVPKDDGYEQLVDIDATRMGAWKKQFDSPAGYAGKKLYYYYDETGKEVVKAKGVSRLTLEQLKTIINTGTVVGTYLTCSTPREVLFKGKRPCVFDEKERQLRLLNVTGEYQDVGV